MFKLCKSRIEALQSDGFTLESSLLATRLINLAQKVVQLTGVGQICVYINIMGLLGLHYSDKTRHTLAVNKLVDIVL